METESGGLITEAEGKKPGADLCSNGHVNVVRFNAAKQWALTAIFLK
jgi:hypothetical protein